MPIHDWTRVDAGIFHHFHHSWIEEIQRTLNNGILPDEYYALAEQHAGGFGPDVLTLQGKGGHNGAASDAHPATPNNSGTTVLLAPPRVRMVAESAMEFYRRKQSTITIRHVSGDGVVAMVEVVSPGNKSGRHALRSFVDKAAELLDKGIHLLILDLHPPGKRDPNGIHAAIWEEISGDESQTVPHKPLTLAAYESGQTVRAYVETVAVGDLLTDMPLFLEPGAHVLVPLDQTYEAAWAAFPRRWKAVLEHVVPG